MVEDRQIDRMLLRPEIADSWLRSRRLGVDPFLQQSEVTSLAQLPHFDDNRLLLKNADSYLKRLYNTVIGSDFVLCLVDRNGYILDMMGDRTMLSRVERIAMVPGSNWAEPTVGSGGIGISLTTAQPAQVTSMEHYIQICHGLTCSAAPVLDRNGSVLGVVNITADCKQFHPHTLGMTVAAADAISTDIIHRQHYEAFRFESAESAATRTRGGNAASYRFDQIIGESAVMQRTIARARRMATDGGHILITGESGTGKELFAQAIHNESTRQRAPFVAVNSAAIPSELAASEYFGYVEGAFTGARRNGAPGKFEQANGGTLFLDEIGDMPAAQQAALLRVIEELQVVRIGGQKAIPVDVRIISASNQALADKLRQGSFRSDLFYRLCGLVIELPPLRKREGDAALLAQHFAARFAPERTVSFSEEALQKLASYDWPGNVRELQNVVRQALFEAAGDRVEAGDIRFSGSALPAAGDLSLKNMEDNLIRRAMEQSGGNVNEAAELLGISARTLYRRLQE